MPSSKRFHVTNFQKRMRLSHQMQSSDTDKTHDTLWVEDVPKLLPSQQRVSPNDVRAWWGESNVKSARNSALARSKRQLQDIPAIAPETPDILAIVPETPGFLRLPNELLHQIMMQVSSDDPRRLLALMCVKKRFAFILSSGYTPQCVAKRWFSTNFTYPSIIERIVRLVRLNCEPPFKCKLVRSKAPRDMTKFQDALHFLCGSPLRECELLWWEEGLKAGNDAILCGMAQLFVKWTKVYYKGAARRFIANGHASDKPATVETVKLGLHDAILGVYLLEEHSVPYE
ncbi:hypothetical protein BJ508DRAFT_314889 [Ascobolus immersus RN42]|uniref:F-box domain-containing protein n=1 Tax=Ascobolus immersus RN42 TaxID=1160509 RepID=A0A3N4HD85_ASCIM|nr:hypothetical protein BJ508DRAFT_314889 [Ascobolus immersus RN42]